VREDGVSKIRVDNDPDDGALMCRRTAGPIIAAFVLLAAAPGAHAATPAVATTHIVPIGKTNSGTGDSAAPPITATVVTADTGSSISSSGYGTGFQTQGLYVSVLYENGSKPTGPGACLPSGKVNFGDRIIGAWVPDGSTTRVLAPVTEIGQAYTGTAGANTGGSLVGNWDRGTVSVRMVNLIKPPTLYANLQACGRVHTTSTASVKASNLWANTQSAVDALPSLGSLPFTTVAKSTAAPVNPIAPGLLVDRTPTAIPTVSPVRTITKVVSGTSSGTAPTVTITHTVTVPQVSTVTVPKVTTITVPKVSTITTPPVTVTTPPITVTAPGVTVPGLDRTR
jgi:hypothetical protein